MYFLETLVLAVGLSMDAFAVSLCKGLSLSAPKGKHYLCIGLWFGGFQMLMPFLGYTVGRYFEPYIIGFAVVMASAFGSLLSTKRIMGNCVKSINGGIPPLRYASQCIKIGEIY